MKKYIECEEIVKCLRELPKHHPMTEIAIGETLHSNSIDIPPVVHGYWTQDKWPVSVPGLDDRCWTCSACGESQSYGECNFCPHCGAKMVP